MSGGLSKFDFDSECRLADVLLKRCMSQLKSDSEVERALASPGALVAIAKLRTVPDADPDILCLNIFRLGATVALSIRDVEQIK